MKSAYPTLGRDLFLAVAPFLIAAAAWFFSETVYQKTVEAELARPRVALPVTDAARPL